MLESVDIVKNATPQKLAKLTQTELKVLRLTGEYKTSKDISQILLVSTKNGRNTPL